MQAYVAENALEKKGVLKSHTLSHQRWGERAKSLLSEAFQWGETCASGGGKPLVVEEKPPRRKRDQKADNARKGIKN